MWCSDEFYLLAERDLPDEDYFEDFSQLENGVGMLRVRLLYTLWSRVYKVVPVGSASARLSWLALPHPHSAWHCHTAL